MRSDLKRIRPTGLRIVVSHHAARSLVSTPFRNYAPRNDEVYLGQDVRLLGDLLFPDRFVKIPLRESASSLENQTERHPDKV